MSAAIKALNARIRSNPVSDYLCSTHFWGPASNFGIPIAAVMDTQKDAEIISGPMTLALSCYSGIFMRYSLAVTPKNYLLFGCHIVNFSAQLTQGYRYINHWYMGGSEKRIMQEVENEGTKVGKMAEGVVNDAKAKAGDVKAKVEEKVR